MQPCFELCSSVCEDQFLDAEISTGLIEPYFFLHEQYPTDYGTALILGCNRLYNTNLIS
jgi:hypothetical protein